MARISAGRERLSTAALPSEQELSIMRNSEYGVDPAVGRRTASGRGQSYGMTSEQAIGAASLMERRQVVSPLAGLPVAASSGDFAFAKSVLGSAAGADGLWDDYWEDNQAGYDYANLAVQPMDSYKAKRDRTPAPISLVPTSTTNPDRPRTVAAGYAARRMVLTVVFRDGTFYNYYEVTADMWNDFKAEHSKGEYIRTWLDGQPRGAANMAKSPVYAREQLYRVARTGQLVNDGQPQLQFDRSLAPRLNPTKSRPKPGQAPKPSNPASKPSRNGMKRSK